jgi:hypothetical protein
VGNELIGKPEETTEEKQPLPFMHIQMLEDGSVVVDGPLGNKGLCYSMLEQARDVVLAYGHREAAKQLMKPTSGLMNHLRRFKH